MLLASIAQIAYWIPSRVLAVFGPDDTSPSDGKVQAVMDQLSVSQQRLDENVKSSMHKQANILVPMDPSCESELLLAQRGYV